MAEASVASRDAAGVAQGVAARETAPAAAAPVLPVPSSLSAARAQLRGRLSAVHWRVRRYETGWVESVGDGVAKVGGLPSAQYGELLEAPGGLTGLCFDLDTAEIGVLFLDSSEHIAAGDSIRSTGRVASVPVGPALLGRVVDALGRPLDGGPPIRARTYSPVEREAPGLVARQPVRETLHTGLTVIDSMLPLGRGQRELILGDHAMGKTALALDVILSQRDSDVVCVYAAIGQRSASIVDVVETLRAHGALANTIVVAAAADAPPGQQYLAPYAACAMGEHFAQEGRHVLVVYDDLTKHADAYRRIALLLGRAPSREAYPADVFYLHSRLLERATRLDDSLGGGSLTALPLAQTQAGYIAGYIPTNLISITDGQICLDTRLFNEGVRPAVDVGLSVSRVGGRAQPPALRKYASDLRLVYNQLRELETFTRFGAELEPEVRNRLDRGRRLREVLKQARLDPLRLGHEVALLLALREGFLDPIPVGLVGAFVAALRRRLDDLDAATLDAIDQTGELSDAAEQRLRDASAAAQRETKAEAH